MRLFSRDKPKIKIETEKADGFSGWLKCTNCQEMIHTNELTGNNNCCPKCDCHYRITVKKRLELLVDQKSFVELFQNITPLDALEFVDREAYPDRLEKAAKKSGGSEAIVTGECTIGGIRTALGVFDFNFMSGSMGSVVGERLTRLIEFALEQKIPLVTVSASGGARMQESILSLMQMAKTSAALAKLHDAKVPYLSILTNPTCGGVTASFASLGDLIIAEPGALVCFAGPRIVEQVIRQKLPPGAQKSEFLLKHGMIDAIVSRHEMKERVALLLSYLVDNEREYSDKNLSELFLLTDQDDL